MPLLFWLLLPHKILHNLNFELFIAKGILSKDKRNFSRPIVRISIISIALGIAVMIISVAVTTGFKSAISNKVIGFGSDIQITSYDLNKSAETAPISRNQQFYPVLEKMEGIRHIQVFATKSGLIKTPDQIQGVIFKGIGNDYDWSFFNDKIIQGSPIIIDTASRNDHILISKKLGSLLKIKLGDEVKMYFVNEGELQPRGRKFTIAGIYETGLEEFDDTFVIGDLQHIQKLNNWTDDQVSGFEVFIDDFKNIQPMTEKVLDEVGYDLNATSIRDLYPQIFEWLDLQDINVIIILILMVAVAIINMISTLLILIIEKTNMIGILKSLGAQNMSIRKIFLYNAAFIIGQGLLWGNFFGIGLAALQYKFHLFKLAQESYYVPYVPINLDILPIILLNAGTLLVCVLFLLVPSFVITRISPIKAIRYE
jgi:lipoprotein-releasing system permease protein